MKRKNSRDNIKSYPFILTYDSEDKVYIAKAIDLKGCHSDGRSAKEAIDNIYEAIAGWIETAHKNKILVPKPSSLAEKSKKFLLRLDAQNLSKLQTLAAMNNKSINTLINEAVEAL